MSTPTPRPALKATGVRRRDARCPETELATLTTERDRLRAEVEALKQSIESGQRVLREDAERNAVRAERAEADAAAYLKRAESFRKIGDEAEAELTAERARLDWLQEHALAQHSEGISISKLGKHYNGFPGSLRAAIDAAMKEDAIK